MTLSPSTIRLDLKCGKGAISKGEKCYKGISREAIIGAGIGVGAIGLTAALVAGGRRGAPRARPHPTNSLPNNPPQPLLPGGPPPIGLLAPGAPRMGRTRRMEQNVQAMERTAERRVAATAQAEVTRLAQVGNTMAALGEASGARVKLTARNLRLRAEAARRRLEPGYRRSRRAEPQPPAQLPEGGQQTFQAPFNPGTNPPPQEELIPIDPRTGQPRRRKPRGFGN